MTNDLRQEIRTLLDGTDCIRPAVLRRSLREDFLYATDLPQAADPRAADEFRRTAEAAGWRTAEAEGWIQLDRIPDHPAGICPGEAGPETRCCRSLLARYKGEKRNGDREKRLLLKAAEEGTAAWEKACRKLHTEWAGALRKKEPLPDLPAAIFGPAAGDGAGSSGQEKGADR